MKWLAKINLRVMIQQLGALQSALLIMFTLLISLYCGYRLGNYYHGYQKQQINVKNQQLTKLYKQVDQSVKQIHYLQVELDMEKLANQHALDNMKTMEAEQYRIKKQLAFYEKVMAPEKRADGVVLDSIIVNPSDIPQLYHFQLVLVQQDKRKKYANGYVSLRFTGNIANQQKIVSISDISSITKSQLSFNFKYFQMIEGDFRVPKAMLLEKVDIAVILPKGRWQKYQRLDESYRWSDLMKTANDSPIDLN